MFVLMVAIHLTANLLRRFNRKDLSASSPLATFEIENDSLNNAHHSVISQLSQYW